jgi:chromosome segregation ATPase
MKKPARKTAKTAARAKPPVARRVVQSRTPKGRPAPDAKKRSSAEPEVAELKRMLAQRDRVIAKLEAQGAKAEARIEKLDARIGTLKAEAKTAKAEMAEWEEAFDQQGEGYAELQAKYETDKGIWKEKYDSAFQVKLKGESAVAELAQIKARRADAVDGRVAILIESTQKYKDLWEEQKKMNAALVEHLAALQPEKDQTA